MLVAGCQSVKEEGAQIFSGGNSLEAPLQPIGGSAAKGAARFAPTSSGVAMTVSVGNLVPGQLYRVVIHANGNCSSPNGFSAGPPWIPAGKTERTMRDMATGQAINDGSMSLVVRISDIHVNGPDSLFGKSVIVHQGTQGSLEAKPGVPNDGVACGVIGPVDSGL
jgi:superoxide dismutase, Cu-Zn family